MGRTVLRDAGMASAWPRRGSSALRAHHDGAALDFQRHRRQAGAGAGAGDAGAVFDAKEGAVGGAEDQRLARVEELIGLPVERPAGMGAVVDIALNAALVAHHEKIEALGSITETETLGAHLFDVVEAADLGAGGRRVGPRQHGPCRHQSHSPLKGRDKSPLMASSTEAP